MPNITVEIRERLDRFAAAALSGLTANRRVMGAKDGSPSAEELATLAWHVAIEMERRREHMVAAYRDNG